MIFTTLRAIIGFILVLFIPGYAISWAFFPNGKEIDWLERLALSIGLSISSVVLAIYASNVVFGLKIKLVNTLIIIFLITFVFSSVGYLRRKAGMREDNRKDHTSNQKKGEKKSAKKSRL